MTSKRKVVETDFSLSPEQYFEMLKDVELGSIHLIECTASHRPFAARIKTVLEPDYEIKFIKADAEQATFLAELSLVGRQGKATPLKLKAVYELRLSLNQELSEEFFHIYAQNNMLFHVFPYFREWVSSTSSRMSIPTIVLPLVKPA